MSKKKTTPNKVFLICNASISDEIDESIPFVLLCFDRKTLQDIHRYKEVLKEMKKAGLDPYTIREFNYGINFVDPTDHNPLSPSEKAQLMYFDKETQEAWESYFENSEVHDSELDDLIIETANPDCSMLTVKKDEVYFDCYVQHTNIKVTSAAIPLTVLRKMARKLEA